jgi:hypothetical protein
MVRGDYNEKSLEHCIDTVLILAQGEMQKRIDVYKTDVNKNPRFIHDFFPLPVLKPQKKL